MSTAYVPQQRQVRLEVLTNVGWIQGTLYLPLRSAIADHLNHSREFFALTDVRFETQAEPLKFFAVQREQVLLAVATHDEPIVPPNKGEMVSYRVSVMLERGSVYGTLDLLKGIRTSDFFAHQRGFVSLRQAQAILTDRFGEKLQRFEYREVLVGSRHIIGIADVRSDLGAT